MFAFLGRFFLLGVATLLALWRMGRRLVHRGVRYSHRHSSALLVWGMAAFFFIAGVSALWAASLRIPDLAAIEERKVEQSVKIYDRTGQVLLYDFHRDQQRTVVPISQISRYIQNATIAIEDAEFYTHAGVRPLATLRAVFIQPLRGLGIQGGSTITQQVVKGSILTFDKSVTRKLKEWVLAVKLDQSLTKEQILELYLNQVPYGGTVYGVEEASQRFFGKTAADVGLAEAAYLAAILPAPTFYSPYGNNRDALDARKNLVLSKMLEHGYISPEEHDTARTAEVTFVSPRDTSILAPHFVFYVREYLEEKYGSYMLEQSGWRITTSLDFELQQEAERIVREGALRNTEDFNASNAALVAIDPQNGNILSMVGSRYYFDTEIPGAYNAATSKPGRQPGSAFKPFAYAQAFLEGYTPETVVFDVRTQFSTACQPNDFTPEYPCYSPVNYDNLFRGPMSLRNALAQSINVPAVKVLYLAGLTDTLRLAKAMGINTLEDPSRYGLTLVLGGGEVTLLDITSAYGVFATDGIRYDPITVLKIEDREGNLIEDNTQPQGTRILPASVAQQINDVLSDPVARAPLGIGSVVPGGRDVAVKTGTTNDYRDAWTIGYTPNLVLGMWAGNNDNTEMERRVSGLIVGPMWGEAMRYGLSKLPVRSFSRAEYSPSPKPVLNGIWQFAGADGAIHDILYWVDKNNPQGPVPTNPANDPQYRYWEIPVAAWAAQNGFTNLQPIFN
jgi:membrane peptidoglycan carboxypeptidase